MFKKLLLIALLAFMASAIHAQGNSASPSTDIQAGDFVLRVVVDSLNIRALPTTESDRVGSLFEGDNVYAVGRNIDGTWFEIQRPSKQTNAGWVSREYFSFTFDTTQLPITDLTVGMIGETTIVDTGISALVLTEAALRVEPFLTANVIDNMKILRVIPVLERTPDNLWVKVNYLGQVGWVAEYLLRIPAGVNSVPVAEEFLNSGLVPVRIIPPEVQRAHAQRFIDYATPIYATAQEIATFWSQLTEGLTIPCNPPVVNFSTFAVTQDDLFELPELRGANRLIPTAISDLNASVEVMRRCGVFTPTEIRGAYADAINASAILGNGIGTMEFVLATVLAE